MSPKLIQSFQRRRTGTLRVQECGQFVRHWVITRGSQEYLCCDRKEHREAVSVVGQTVDLNQWTVDLPLTLNFMMNIILS